MNETTRWIVKFKKDRENFILKFSQIDDMLIACVRARGAGYQIKTLNLNRPVETKGR